MSIIKQSTIKNLLLCLLLSSFTLAAQVHYPLPKISWNKELVSDAQKGSMQAQRNLGLCLLYGLGVEKSENEAFAWFEKAAKQGDAEAQTYVGDFYYGEFGDLFEEEVEQAYEWYKRAASQNFPEGIYLLSQCYNLGEGVEENESEYLRLLQKAAELGCANAQYELALEYKDGKRLPKDDNKYFYYFTQAAEAGILNAMVTMGMAYYNGTGVSIDYDRAFKYLKNAVDYVERNDSGYGWLNANDKNGLKMLSACYRFGRGCAKNESLADKYLELASHIESMNQAEIREALKLLNIASSDPDVNAATKLKFK